MPDLLGNAMRWLEAQRRKYLTVPAIYRRGDLSVELPATIGRTVFKVSDDYGRFQYIESRDYLVNSADLVLSGITVLPKKGDEIIESGQIYEVLAPNSEPEWRYSDSSRQCLRIHTKHTGEE